MTQPAAALPMAELSRFGMRELGLWAGAAALVLLTHVAIAYAVQDWTADDATDGGPPPALVIEMSPMVVMPAVQEQAAMLDAVTPDQTEPVEEAEKIAPVEPVVEPEKLAEAEPVVEQPEAVPVDEPEPTQPTAAEQADQSPPLEEVIPDIVETVAPEVVVPLPQPKAVEAPVKKKPPVQAKAKKPVEPKAKKPVEKPKQRPKKEKAAPVKTAAVASADARPAAKVAGAKSAESASRSGASSARWDSKLSAWIRRHTRYPSAARARRVEGTPRVTFTVDASGRVISARVSGSSGDADLDRAALKALQGASVPAPPPELGSRVSRTAPFVFRVRD